MITTVNGIINTVGGIVIINAANNSSTTSNTTDIPNNPSYIDSGVQCESDDICSKITKRIREIMHELMRRYNHQCRDKKGQWQQHLPAYEGKKRQLLNWVIQAEMLNCPVPAKAYKWLVTECPLPGTNVKNNPSPGY
ncbi:MAG: hypothetical protein AB2794_09630 [Candidatus Thiodiazotropha endolucinida]